MDFVSLGVVTVVAVMAICYGLGMVNISNFSTTATGINRMVVKRPKKDD
jgi:hypothetical protein